MNKYKLITEIFNIIKNVNQILSLIVMKIIVL